MLYCMETIVQCVDTRRKENAICVNVEIVQFTDCPPFLLNGQETRRIPVGNVRGN